MSIEKIGETLFNNSLEDFKEYIKKIFSNYKKQVWKGVLIARKVRKILGNRIISSYPIDLDVYLKKAKAEVIYLDIINSGYTINIPQFYKDFFSETEYLICVNRNEPKTRNRFVIAHELGHIFLKHLNPTNKFYINTAKWKYEIEANSFAGETLVPTSVLKNLIYTKKVTSIEHLSQLFEVSIYVVYYQVILANLESDVKL